MEDPEPEEEDYPPIVPNKGMIQFGGKYTTYDLQEAANDYFATLDQNDPSWLKHGLHSRTGDMVNFSRMKLNNEEEKIMEAITNTFEAEHLQLKNQTKGYFQDDLGIDLTNKPQIDKQWLLKANPGYAKHLRDRNIADVKKLIMKKLQMKFLDRIRSIEMKKKERRSLREMKRSQEKRTTRE